MTTITDQDVYRADSAAHRKGRPTQNDLLLDRLRKAKGEWVAMPELGAAMGGWAVHSRIADLRRLGHPIPPPRRTWRDGVCCTEYRLVILAPA